VTDIYGVLYRPRGFDPAQRYPVVDSVYPGPQVDRVAPGFDPGGMGLDAEPIAALGFVVVAVDGRGTPGRSKSFHDASYGHLADAGCLADHVAALQQLAQTRPWMDLDRVGAFGHSGGGFATARAMLDFPEVYKAGVALSGSHDARYFNLGFVEAYDGADNPEAWARASNVDIADRLAGRLLLIHGEWTTKSTRTTRCGWPTGSSPPTRTSSCSSCPGPSTRSSTAWPTSASAAGTFWCAS
jgi:dipeptidyl-peptidase-4